VQIVGSATVEGRNVFWSRSKLKPWKI